MSRKNIGYGLVIIGILVFAVSLSADLLGIGSGSSQTGWNQIGWRQWLGAGIGFIIAVVGIFISLTKKE
jgi:hypothetical protein